MDNTHDTNDTEAEPTQTAIVSFGDGVPVFIEYDDREDDEDGGGW